MTTLFDIIREVRNHGIQVDIVADAYGNEAKITLSKFKEMSEVLFITEENDEQDVVHKIQECALKLGYEDNSRF